jgi:hypothetical protein
VQGGRVDDLTILPGRYYVDGLVVDATRVAPPPAVPDGEPDAVEDDAADAVPEPWTYWDQPYAYRDRENEADALPEGRLLVYLRVHDRLVTAVQDPLLLETALGAALPDTAARIRTEWQVGVLPIDGRDLQGAAALLAERLPRKRRMAARATRPPRADEDPCTVLPEAGYRGPENQLYRLEIHGGGKRPNFKWSRENGSVVFPVEAVDGVWLTLATLGRDDKLDLEVGSFVEVLDDAAVARGELSDLFQITEVDLAGRRVQLSAEPAGGVGRRRHLHPYLRRWDQREPRRRGEPALAGGAVSLQPGTWIDLEAGVQVYFEQGVRFRSGDFWTVAARTISGDVEWPQDGEGRPLLLEPDGIVHHYAPLAIVDPTEAENEDVRRVFCPLPACP